MAGRPNRLIRAMKQRDFRSFLWEALLHEYRCAKIGDTEHRLGPNALTSLIAALREIESTKSDASSTNLVELEDWVKKIGGE
jgi:hypothetical protein